MGIRVMIGDSSARAHALAAKYAQSDKVDILVVAPGNDFIKWAIESQYEKEVIIASATLDDAHSFLHVAQQHRPNLIDIMQDDALSAGTVDKLQEYGFATFGATKAASEIEHSKGFSRKLMEGLGIPSP